MTTFDLVDPHDLERVRLAAACLDRIAEAQVAIKRDGAYIQGRFGMKAHPALAVERDARLAYMRAVREVGLDNAQKPTGRWRDRA